MTKPVTTAQMLMHHLRRIIQGFTTSESEGANVKWDLGHGQDRLVSLDDGVSTDLEGEKWRMFFSLLGVEAH